MTVRFQFEGYHSVTPYLIIKGAAAALDFYKGAFGGQVIVRMDDKDRIGHAERKIGDSVVLADEYPEMGHRSPATLGGCPVQLLVYVPDVDAAFAQAVKAGATVERPVADQFYGDRLGGLKDPFGHLWYLATHVEDMSPEEMKRRSDAAVAKK